jgi:peptidoglycan lytic transglycosylase
MHRIACKVLGMAMLAGWAAGCATEPPPETTSTAGSPGGGSYRVGKPYQIGDSWYYPHEQPDYDETGIASWYGPTFYGKPTANGELYDGDGLTAAHRTLPLPVNVRVTNLDNGKSIVVRVNDRGPFAKGRIIDVSKRAAELLGFYAQGTAHVRVTYLGRADAPNGETPSDEAGTVLARTLKAAPAGRVSLASLDRSRSAAPRPVQVASLEPPPVTASDAEQNDDIADLGPQTDEHASRVATVPMGAQTHLYIQAGAFGSRENAERLKDRLATDLFISAQERNGRTLYLVRSGPYDDLDAANAALARLADLGNNDAKIVVDR